MSHLLSVEIMAPLTQTWFKLIQMSNIKYRNQTMSPFSNIFPSLLHLISVITFFVLITCYIPSDQSESHRISYVNLV